MWKERREILSKRALYTFCCCQHEKIRFENVKATKSFSSSELLLTNTLPSYYVVESELIRVDLRVKQMDLKIYSRQMKQKNQINKTSEKKEKRKTMQI